MSSGKRIRAICWAVLGIKVFDERHQVRINLFCPIVVLNTDITRQLLNCYDAGTTNGRWTFSGQISIWAAAGFKDTELGV